MVDLYLTAWSALSSNNPIQMLNSSFNVLIVNMANTMKSASPRTKKLHWYKKSFFTFKGVNLAENISYALLSQFYL